MIRFLALLLLPLASTVASGSEADWITALGGSVERDDSGAVVAVNLRGTWVNDAELLELVRLPKLRRLDLSHTRISDEGLLHLKPCRTIENLNLFYAEQISDQGMNAIKEWRGLRHLNLRGTRIADGTLAVVAKLTALESLDVANTNITDNGLDHLVALTRLKHLALGRSRLSETATNVVRLMNTLESLDLSGPRAVNRNQRSTAGNLPPQTVEALAELTELRVLKLGHLPVDAAALRVLAAKLTKLEKLGLEACGAKVDDAALRELIPAAKLRYLDVQETAVTQAGINELRSGKPELQVLTTAAVLN